MSTAPKSYTTPEEYLQQERNAKFRGEYIGGEVFVMAGGTSSHNRITGNIVSALRPQLRGKSCFIYLSDMKVWIPDCVEFTYPDVMAVCGKEQFRDQVKDVLLNPVLIIEVLFPSTNSYDRGEKFERYRRISSFREYLLVAQSEPRIERYQWMDEQRWMLTIHTDIHSSVALSSIPAELRFVDAYEDVQFA